MTPQDGHNSISHPAQAWSEPDFAAVLVASQAGEGWAYERLYRWLAPRVTNYAAARGAEDAEVITNDVFLRAFSNIDRFRGDGSGFQAWIYSIARNRLIDSLRAAARRPQVATTEIPEVAIEGAETAAMVSLGAEWVTEMLSVLSEDQRDVIVLRLVADLSLQQVATVVDKPLTAVKALQRRGLRRLQSELLAEVVVR